ncbi:hypothetical protein ACFL4L_06995 [bacterium]
MIHIYIKKFKNTYSIAIDMGWGAGDFLYVIQGGDFNDLLQVNMGTTGAP